MVAGESVGFRDSEGVLEWDKGDVGGDWVGEVPLEEFARDEVVRKENDVGDECESDGEEGK